MSASVFWYNKIVGILFWFLSETVFSEETFYFTLLLPYSNDFHVDLLWVVFIHMHAGEGLDEDGPR